VLPTALGWLLEPRDPAVRAEVDEPRAPSRRVTLRACRVLKAALG
jgi:hypothetical protein